MNDSHTSEPSHDTPVQRRARASAWKLAAFAAIGILSAYLVLAYLVLPLIWVRYAHRHPALDDTPGITYTGDRHPGDPINVALIGSEDDVKTIMSAAGWYVADPLGLRSDLEIASDTVFKRSDNEAPVSSLYLWGRKEDLAFEQPVGDNPRQRHHVRFWESTQVDERGRQLWAGSATYDERVGLSHTTGQITHHIAADVDAERDHLFDDLNRTGRLSDVKSIDGFHRICEGRNGGGDPWHTDGRLLVGTIQAEAAR